MKNINILSVLAIAALGVSSANAAEDITSPMYLPSESEVFSDTAVSYQRTVLKKDVTKENFSLYETALVGFGSEGAVMAKIGNRFNFKHLTNEEYNNDLNLDYELGAKKNLRSADGLVLQAGASYYTYNPRSWYGRSGRAKNVIREFNGGNTRWHKELRGDLKLGYELENGLMPYTDINIAGNIDDADRELDYSVLAGVHKLENNFAFDAGIRYEFDFGSDKIENWYMQGSSDYFLTDNMTLGGYADYRFAGAGDLKIDYAYSVEARFKILF